MGEKAYLTEHVGSVLFHIEEPVEGGDVVTADIQHLHMWRF